MVKQKVKVFGETNIALWNEFVNVSGIKDFYFKLPLNVGDECKKCKDNSQQSYE